MNVLEVSNDEYTQRDARRRKQAQRIHRPDVVGSWGRASSVAMVLWAMRSDCTKPLTQRGRCHRLSSRRQRRSMSAICASGCLIRQLRTISPTTRCHQASRCQSSKPWCSRAMTVPSISWRLRCHGGKSRHSAEGAGRLKSGGGFAWAIKRTACSVRSPAFSGPASPNKLVSSVASGARWRDGQAAGRCARR
jgi:hypothetical protein